MTVKVSLELEELQLQVSGRPEQRPVETFAADRADQAFDEGMRQRHVRHRLDGFHVENSQIRLPLVEVVLRIMVRAEVELAAGIYPNTPKVGRKINSSGDPAAVKLVVWAHLIAALHA